MSARRFNICRCLLGALALSVSLCLGEEDEEDPWYADAIPSASRRHTTMEISEDNTFRVYHGVCFHNGKVFAIVPTGKPSNITTAINANQNMVELPSVDGASFFNNVDAVWLPGNTLAINFAFPGFPDNMGHWAETVLPTFSVFQSEHWHTFVRGAGASAAVIDTILLTNLRANQLSSWFLETLRIVLAPVTGLNGPQVIDMQDLSEIEKVRWLAVENIITVTDRYSHPAGRAALEQQRTALCSGTETCPNLQDLWTYGFQKPEHAAEFRQAAYAKVNAPPIATGSDSRTLPRTITFMTAASGEVITNKYDVTAMLWRVAATYGWRVRPLTITNLAPFNSHVTAMAETGILIARHGPTLANSVFLPPGAAVYELLPFNWEWRRISELYRNITTSSGELHHFAWRAQAVDWVDYSSADDSRYSTWTAKECISRTCMLTHAKAGLRVDVNTMEADLASIMERMNAPAAEDACDTVECHVAELSRDWPHIV